MRSVVQILLMSQNIGQTKRNTLPFLTGLPALTHQTLSHVPFPYLSPCNNVGHSPRPKPGFPSTKQDRRPPSSQPSGTTRRQPDHSVCTVGSPSLAMVRFHLTQIPVPKQFRSSQIIKIASHKRALFCCCIPVTPSHCACITHSHCLHLHLNAKANLAPTLCDDMHGNEMTALLISECCQTLLTDNSHTQLFHDTSPDPLIIR
ncbi:hypothetical protein QBC40DRAFT_277417 [Triangularia verruculosa]|uniref:Uncharacterized protein n=1 Tax=Triangularia verruculosa TaxID=2587418 RepID=A0AAN7AW94_9PEZI|nr:hypothetical protein QBC40DRAFT_277417 [Triangularia verruculosa]